MQKEEKRREEDISAQKGAENWSAWAPRANVCRFVDTAQLWCLGRCLNRGETRHQTFGLRCTRAFHVTKHMYPDTPEENSRLWDTRVRKDTRCTRRWGRMGRRREEEGKGGWSGNDKFCQTHERYLSWPLANPPPRCSFVHVLGAIWRVYGTPSSLFLPSSCCYNRENHSLSLFLRSTLVLTLLRIRASYEGGDSNLFLRVKKWHIFKISKYITCIILHLRGKRPSLFLVDTLRRRSLIVSTFEVLCLREANAGNKSMTSAMLSLHATPHDIEYSLYREGRDQTYRRWGYISTYM